MRLLIRADGDHSLGTGHVLRTLALAEHVVDAGGEATLLSATLDDGLRRRVERAGVAVLRNSVRPGSSEDAAAVVAEAAALSSDWIVVDSYAADPSFQAQVHAAGRKVLLIDDYADHDQLHADIVLNQNAFAMPELYEDRAGQTTRLLLGPSFALLRREFCGGPVAAKPIPDRADRVLVTLGGADPGDLTTQVVDALTSPVETSDAATIRIVIGASNPRRLAVARLLEHRPAFEFVEPIDDMRPLMEWADLAVTGAGITVYELMSVGVPICVLPIVRGQQRFAEALGKTNACVSVGWQEAVDVVGLRELVAQVRRDAVRRRAMSRAGRAMVDGRGVARVLGEMAAYA